MRLRRCLIVFLEPRQDAVFDLGSLLHGGNGLALRSSWVALAPHLEAELEVDTLERELLGRLGPDEWTEHSELEVAWQGGVDRLIDLGLLICDDARSARYREREDALRSGYWWGPAALMHRFGRWEGKDSVAAMEASGMASVTDMREKLGPPPPEVVERVSSSRQLVLPRVEGNDFDALLERRATCRNFDTQRALPFAMLALMLQRVFAARARVLVKEDTVFLKKNAPSGGGLHATEAYVVSQNVDGLQAGLYHYHPVAHALEPLAPPALPLQQFVARALAGQHWFADAPALVVLAPRYARSFWKYRNHLKAYRALILDAGHLSQLLYLSATEMGLGAFVTSAINEVDIEQAFSIDPLREGPLAICGFGWRSDAMQTTEFDPAGDVWAVREE
jgi:putative peptide maturation dehydrogenase